MAHEHKPRTLSPAELRLAFKARQKHLVVQAGLSEIRVNDEEIIYDDGMLDQCSIGYYPPMKSKFYD